MQKWAIRSALALLVVGAGTAWAQIGSQPQVITYSEWLEMTTSIRKADSRINLLDSEIELLKSEIELLKLEVDQLKRRG